MNVRIATLSILTIAAAFAGTIAQPAMAQGARWTFAPNVWGPGMKKQQQGCAEPPLAKRSYQAPVEPHSVASGMVPTNLLGIDKQMMAKPLPRVAPIAQQTVAAKPSFTNLIAKPIQPTPPQFKAEFGNPIVASAPQVQQLPQPATDQRLQPVKSTAARTSNSLRGVLRPHKAPTALAATGKSIPGYGNQFYMPGAYLPALAGSGSQTSTGVHGVILNHQRTRR